MKNISFIFCLLLSLNLFGQSIGPNISVSALHTGPLTGLHAEVGVGFSPINKVTTNLRVAHNFSQASQFSVDALYTVINHKRFRLSAGMEYTYSLYSNTAYGGYLVPDTKMDACYVCGNSLITTEREYGSYGTVGIPLYLDINISQRISLFTNYSHFLNQDKKIRVGTKWSF